MEQPEPGAAAFVELDHTLVAGAATFALARGLAAKGSLTTRDLAAMAWHHARYSVPGIPGAPGTADGSAGYHGEYVFDVSLDYLAGRGVEHLVSLADEAFDDYIAHSVWPGTQSLLQRHLRRGEQVWLLASTPSEISAVYASRLGLTGALATVAEVRGGRYTGRLLGRPLHGPARAEAVSALARREGLDLHRCTAYAHSTEDLPLLELVGHPVAVNPLPDLAQLARQRGWPRYDFRRRQRRLGLASASAGAAAVGAAVAGTAWARKSLRFGASS